MKGKIVYGENGRPDRYFVDGAEVSKEEFLKAFPDKPISDGSIGGHLTTCWPMRSEAAAVHPKQINKATENARAKGVPTNYDSEGRPIFTSRQHRKEYLKRVEFVVDRNGGYGD